MRLLTAALFLMALPAAAQQQQTTPPVGAGSDSCAVFNNNLKENKADPQVQWVVGYLNGWNELGKSLKKPDLLQQATLPGLQQFIAIYCQQYPAGTMAGAASVIAEYLAGNTAAATAPAPPPPKPAEPPRA